MIETAPEIQALLHPAGAFAHPQDVLDDPDLTTQEKRAILSAWASDACAVESVPLFAARPGRTDLRLPSMKCWTHSKAWTMTRHRVLAVRA